MCIKYCLTISETVQSSENIYKYTDIFRTNNDYFRTNRQYSVSPPPLFTIFHIAAESSFINLKLTQMASMQKENTIIIPKSQIHS